MSVNIEGIPEGWEFVRVGRVFNGEHWVNNYGQPARWDSDHASTSANYVIIRKIEKPKQFRPFANASEFEPHRDRWIRRSCKDDGDKSSTTGCFRVSAYDDRSIWTVDGETISYEGAFESGKKFEDGTPFGVEVTE